MSVKKLQKPDYLTFIPLGRAGEVGRSCYLFGDGEKFVMFDCGTSPKGGSPPRFDLLKGKKILAVLISHSHLDHVGALPQLSKEMNDVAVYSTKLTKELAGVVLKDAIKVRRRKGEISVPPSPKLEENWKTKEYGEEFQLGEGVTVTFKDAGHIPGSAQVFLNWRGTRVIYTGDICAFKTNLSGKFEEWKEGADIVISESTYGKEFSKPSGALSVIAEEGRLIEEIKRTLRRKGRILIPCFANGRAQEIMYVIAKAIEKGALPRIPCYSIGLLNSMLDVIGEEGTYRKKVALIKKHFVSVGFPRLYAKPELDKKFEAIKESKEPSIIVSTPGMLTMGASANLAIKFFDEPRSAIFIVGYQDEDAPGRILEKVEKGGKFTVAGSTLGVKCDVKKFEIRGHIHPKDLMKTITKANPKFVIFVHGSHAAQNVMKSKIRESIPKCRVFPSNQKTSFGLHAGTWEYKLISLPIAPSTEKIRTFVVDGILEEIPHKEEFKKMEFQRNKGKKYIEERWTKEILEVNWTKEILEVNFRLREARVLSYWISAGEYPRRVRLVVKGARDKIWEAAALLKEPRVVESVTRTDWLPFEGKRRFSEATQWLGRYERKIKRVPLPKFDSFPIGEGRSGLYMRRGRIYINPITNYDEDLKKAVLYHEIAHHLMDGVRKDLIELAKEHGFIGKAFVEGAAEYLALKLGADRIFIETEKIGDDGIYYSTSESNPYVYGWYMFNVIDKAMGEKRAVEILLSGSPGNLKKAFAWVKGTSRMLERFLRATDIMGRMYLRGVPHNVEVNGKVALLYAPKMNEGRLYMNDKVWVIKNLRERKSILYRLGRFFGIIRHPWSEAEFIRERAEGKKDFSYRIPPKEISRVIEVHKLCLDGARVSKKAEEVTVEAKGTKPVRKTRVAPPVNGKRTGSKTDGRIGTKYCYECGAKISARTSFCPMCGKKQPPR